MVLYDSHQHGGYLAENTAASIVAAPCPPALDFPHSHASTCGIKWVDWIHELGKLDQIRDLKSVGMPVCSAKRNTAGLALKKAGKSLSLIASLKPRHFSTHQRKLKLTPRPVNLLMNLVRSLQYFTALYSFTIYYRLIAYHRC